MPALLVYSALVVGRKALRDLVPDMLERAIGVRLMAAVQIQCQGRAVAMDHQPPVMRMPRVRGRYLEPRFIGRCFAAALVVHVVPEVRGFTARDDRHPYCQGAFAAIGLV